MHLWPDLDNARGDAVPLLERVRCRPFADQNWITPAHEVPRPKRGVSDNIADLVDAHHRRSQCRHVGSRRCTFLPASAFEVIEAAAFAYVEARLWPNGPVCHHCGETERIGRLQGKTTRPGLYKCYACRKPFTVRMGTIFESSHLPLHLWLQIIHLMCASKKGISTHQIQRMLRCSMKTAWFLGHRIRESMREVRDMFTPPMGGAGRTIEADPLAEASATARRRQRTMRSP